MKKNKLIGADEYFYFEKLDNGLEIYMLPKNNFTETYVTFTTRFGSINTEFVPNGKNKMIHVHDGIAHFLEHKMFESEDGVDPFEFYTKNGASCNASTTFNKTTYLFLGPGHVKENVNFLLDYVQSIYLTDENVEKEKGIIEQEINMYKDDPFWALYEGVLRNTFKENNMKNSIAGEVEDIMAITKEELLDCYNTFYHPSNMFLVATGNFDPEELVKIVKENQAKKDFSRLDEIKVKEYKEPDKVVKEYEEKRLSIIESKVAVAYKIPREKFKLKDEFKINKYLSIFIESLFGSTSLFVSEARKENILTDSGVEILKTDSHYLLCLFMDSKEPNKIIDKVNQSVNQMPVTEEDFERRKKVSISNYISSFDNIVNTNEIIVSNVMAYDTYIEDQIDKIKDLSYDEFKAFVKTLDFSNKTALVINPLEESN